MDREKVTLRRKRDINGASSVLCFHRLIEIGKACIMTADENESLLYIAIKEK